MKKITFLIALALCFYTNSFSQSTPKFPPGSPWYIDSVKRADVMDKIIKLADAIRKDNHSAATVLYNLVAFMLMNQENSFASRIESMTMESMRKEVNDILDERKRIEILREIIKKSEN